MSGSRSVAVLRGVGVLLTLLMLTWQLLVWRGDLPSTQLSRLDAVLYDWRMQWLTPQRDVMVPLVVVDIDEFTLQHEGRWPWDRAKIADLIQDLRHAGVALIGFDVVFSEAVENPVDRLLATGGFSPDMVAALSDRRDALDGDARLATVLGPDVVLGFFLHADGASTGVLPPALLTWTPKQAAASSLASLSDYTAGLKQFAHTGAGAGFVVALPDVDGIMRQVPLLLRRGQDVYPSLTLELVRRALGAPWVRLHQISRGTHQVITGVQFGRSHTIPLQPSGSLLVPYKGPAHSYLTIPASVVLQGALTKTQQDALNGSLVLVGTSALGLHDLRSTPLQAGYPGVEVHANMLDALLQAAQGKSTLYMQPDWAPGATLVLVLVLGLVLSLGLPGRSPAWMLWIALGTLLLLLGLNAVLWSQAKLDFPLTISLLSVGLVSLFNIVLGAFLSHRQRRAIQTLFGEYVPPQHVAQMVAQRGAPNLDGQQRTMSVLFADIRDFTATSEPLPPVVLKQWLNRYLTAVTEIIFAQQGTVDKYVGDMVMAFWNAPLDDPDHAAHAVRAALQMQQRLVHLRQTFIAEGLPSLDLGIGIHTGLMNVGDMGSRYRRAYTVLGDAVNLGSRLENLTKFYGVPILLSQETCRAAPGVLYRWVDRVRVKGRQEALDVYQPMASQDDVNEGLQARVTAFEQAVQDYHNARWASARQVFADLQAGWPDDGRLCQVYLDRMVGRDPADLPYDWAAIYDHTSK